TAVMGLSSEAGRRLAQSVRAGTTSVKRYHGHCGRGWLMDDGGNGAVQRSGTPSGAVSSSRHHIRKTLPWPLW
ncbi:hypothetical protein R3X40_25635, partial [Salmonella enterica subsp. enterica serovar Agona]|nr:hypothetical protein [Salmonella enterica subsp. enterica serovar Agona]